MRWGLWAGVLVSTLAAAAPPTAMPVDAGNALTLPAQRHMVRIERGGGRGDALLLAVQRGGSQGRGLGLYRSTDDGRSWRHEGAIHDGRQNRADLVNVGRDVALVHSIETPDGEGISGSAERDVVFQWWRYHASTDRWSAGRGVKVFDSRSSGTAYYRAELARDSRGRLWVQAFRRERDGKSTLVVAVSTDGGNTFREQPALARGLAKRGGGRLLSLGGKLIIIYGTHGTGPARYFLRSDGAPLSSWSSARTAFSEGLYHGAALSAVADGRGGMHLVYKDNSERLLYRRFNGNSFSAPLVVHGRGDWALQPAITRVGGTVHIFYNRPKSGGYDLVVRRLSGRSLGPVRELASVSGFAGYPTAVGVLPSGVRIPCLFGLEPRSGPERLVVVYAPSSRGSALEGEVSASAEPPGGEAVAVNLDLPGEALAVEDAEASAPGGCGGDSSGKDVALLLSVPLLVWARPRRRR